MEVVEVALEIASGHGTLKLLSAIVNQSIKCFGTGMPSNPVFLVSDGQEASVDGYKHCRAG